MIDPAPFRIAAKVYPQPVAAACGRFLRVREPPAQLDACLKAAEVLCRYVAALALASLRSREKKRFPRNVNKLKGNLNFGDYLGLVQASAKVGGHPLESHLGPFRARSRGRGPGKADEALRSLLELRNELSHDLTPTQNVKARALLKKHAPQQRLLGALRCLEGLLTLPLFVLHGIGFRNRQMFAQRLLLMGEHADPVPEELRLLEPLQEQTPYVALDDRALPLTPAMLFADIESPPVQRLAFLHAVKESSLVFKTLDSDTVDDYEQSQVLDALFKEAPSPPHDVRLPDGRPTMQQEWTARRRRIEAADRQSEGTPPWSAYDQNTMAWFAKRVHADAATGPPIEVIVACLLDGRTTGLPEADLRQLLLLFGRDHEIRVALSRDMYDFRSQSRPETRWDNRETGSCNILATFQVATAFFATHVGLDSGETADLSKTEGSANYIAMREALVNQFVHQDFSDPTAAAQVGLQPERAVFFNTGHSLVAADALTDGGRSKARNPLIARALRLIGYAELGGSGIRSLQYEWRQARRRPPLFVSDRPANSFTLTLDWRTVPNAYDQFWKNSIGVEVSAAQAQILNLATDRAGITDHQAAAGTGLLLDDARDSLAYLTRQVLLDEKEGRYHLASHLRDALK